MENWGDPPGCSGHSKISYTEARSQAILPSQWPCSYTHSLCKKVGLGTESGHLLLQLICAPSPMFVQSQMHYFQFTMDSLWTHKILWLGGSDKIQPDHTVIRYSSITRSYPVASGSCVCDWCVVLYCKGHDLVPDPGHLRVIFLLEFVVHTFTHCRYFQCQSAGHMTQVAGLLLPQPASARDLFPSLGSYQIWKYSMVVSKWSKQYS